MLSLCTNPLSLSGAVLSVIFMKMENDKYISFKVIFNIICFNISLLIFMKQIFSKRFCFIYMLFNALAFSLLASVFNSSILFFS